MPIPTNVRIREWKNPPGEFVDVAPNNLRPGVPYNVSQDGGLTWGYMNSAEIANKWATGPLQPNPNPTPVNQVSPNQGAISPGGFTEGDQIVVKPNGDVEYFNKATGQWYFKNSTQNNISPQILTRIQGVSGSFYWSNQRGFMSPQEYNSSPITGAPNSGSTTTTGSGPVDPGGGLSDSTGGVTDNTGSPGYDVQPGLDAIFHADEMALGYATIKNLKDIALIQDATDRYIADIDARYKMGLIDQAEKDRAQNAAQFAQTIALQTRAQAFDEEMGRINADIAQKELVLKERGIVVSERQVGINEAAQVLSERMAFSQLGMSPENWVGYELLKQTYNTPAGQPVQFNEGALLSGLDLQDTGPAYTDQQLQQAMSSAGGMQPAMLQGQQGVFGTQIRAPNFSRFEYENVMSPTDIAMQSGQLRAGITTNSGQIPVNPDDYYLALARGFTPTSQGAPQYIA